MPNIPAIFADSSIRRKLAHMGYVQKRHPGPLILVAKDTTYPVLTVNIGLVVSQEHKFVMVEQGIHQRPENVPIAVRKMATGNQIDDAS